MELSNELMKRRKRFHEKIQLTCDMGIKGISISRGFSREKRGREREREREREKERPDTHAVMEAGVSGREG